MSKRAMGGGGEKGVIIDVLEAQNDEKIQQLEQRVQELKGISGLLRSEIEESNTTLGDITGEMLKAVGKVKQTLKRMAFLSSYKSSGHLWLLAALIAVVVFVLYVSIYTQTLFQW